MIDWMIDSFDPKKVSLGSAMNSFIRTILPKEYRGAPLVNLFEGFFGDRDTPRIA